MIQERSPISIGHRHNDDHNLFFLINLEHHLIVEENEVESVNQFIGFHNCSDKPDPDALRLHKTDGPYSILSLPFHSPFAFARYMYLLPIMRHKKPIGCDDFCVAFEKWLKDDDNKWGGYEFNEEEKESADANVKDLIEQLTDLIAKGQSPGPFIGNPVVQQPFQPNEPERAL